MGNSKNFRNSHARRGKYAKKKVPMTKKGKCNNKLNHAGSRIVYLQEHLQVISQHAATCQPCMVNALSGNEAMVLVGEHNRVGLCSVLSSRCAGYHMEFR